MEKAEFSVKRYRKHWDCRENLFLTLVVLQSAVAVLPVILLRLYFRNTKRIVKMICKLLRWASSICLLFAVVVTNAEDRSCEAGYYCDLARSSIPVPCPVGTFSLGQASACTQCFSGYFQISTGKTYCDECPLGEFALAANNEHKKASYV